MPESKGRWNKMRKAAQEQSKTPYARRVVDLDSNDEEIIRQLSEILQCEYPAYMTHRNGLFKAVGDLYRSYVQYSVGPKRFSKILRGMHMLKYAKLRLQYLQAIGFRRSHPSVKQMMLNAANIVPSSSSSSVISFSEFADRTKYTGHVFSAQYLRVFYTAFIRELRPFMDKQMEVLDGVYLKGDHTFKIIKLTSKLNRQPAFAALYTILNEYEEVRLQFLVPTKSLEHLRYAFDAMRNAYELYGYKQPQVFLTDNVTGDQGFLKRTLPSLTQDVVPVTEKEPSDSMETWSYLLCTVPKDQVTVKCIYNYEDIEDCIDEFLKQGPVQAYLNYISQDYKTPCKGGYELGGFCKSQGAISDGRMGLATIFESVLEHTLFKKDTICTGPWSAQMLSQDQVDYAALDAWAALKIFEEVKSHGTHISYHPGNVHDAAAYSEICEQFDKLGDVINLFTKYRPLRCARTGRLLFDYENWRQAKSVLKTIHQGHLSDPPGIPLYFIAGMDKEGLILYRCSRGTNSLEGGIHQNLICSFGLFGASVELIEPALVDYRLRHNTDVGMANRYGRIHDGHYSPWITQHINDLENALGLCGIHNEPGIDERELQLISSNESFGSSPLPADLMHKYGIVHSTSAANNTTHTSSSLEVATLVIINSSTLHKHSAQYSFIASHQRAAHAIIPVHTPAEKSKFDLLLIDNFADYKTKSIDFQRFAKLWSRTVDGCNIFYQTPEHLRSYYNTWKEQDNVARTITNNQKVIENVGAANNAPDRKRSAPAPKQPVPSKMPRIQNTSADSTSSSSNQQLSNTSHYRQIAPIAPTNILHTIFSQQFSHQLQFSNTTMSHQRTHPSQQQLTLPLYLSLQHAPTQIRMQQHHQQTILLRNSSNNIINSSANNVTAGLPKRHKKTCSNCGEEWCNGKNNQTRY
ncbi:hypothetical protein BDB00DRAFT_879759 [Zychaea mexicana]|uniref:uncharacterized protein n=1 Tax=Zychaea mexicana TaxID=64656 RepID=UPI0022FF3E14|nr:uncharacterized protein BDB00DRAFT_879759 [Zychaea mexicana]KAI9473378.1 hypothetical protein BDB00DRAFT_879759 [Zychaea mexicana]